ncbi:RNA polymerase sigma-70 factor (sigma-E family) [Motilibacter peucedani]|uniref:RNA polymerase sigma-70 factor (Sigma-E family) n=1 Tax=Motilibacter peucedani TaxID=598650 RepID=A0A420XQM3_9ACTN|nr:SigE family RNA polymerase sigma factor [Motilibacter peucedani]RKS75593.1 RNA polymerase sigma-70 factor (sigma-E family) [Motilibacter peucedani]
MREPVGFRAFVEARYPSLVRFGTLLTGDPGRGEDLVQEALVKTLHAWDRLHSDAVDDARPVRPDGTDGGPEAYTRKVMTHAAWRAGKRRWWGERPTDELPEHAAPDAYAQSDTADAVRRALAALPAQQRVVLVLRFWGDYTEAQIADALDISSGTVKSRTSRGIAALRATGWLDEAVVGGGS